MEKNLTSGSVLKNILIFSLPYLLSYFLQTLYGMADLFIIGQYEEVASTTAVSIGSQVMHMLTVVIVGLAMGTTVSVGKAIGAKEHNKAMKYIGNTVVLFVSLSLVFMTVLLCLVKPIVSIMSTPEEAVEGTISYLTVCFIGIPFITAYNIIASIFRGLGDSKSPMWFIAIACIANIILDYVFIGIFKLGPMGAALGTTISQALSVVISLFVILNKKGDLHFTKRDFKIDKKFIVDILKIGLPIAIQDGLIQIAFIIITVIANNRGLEDAAAVGIVEKIIGFVFLVPSSMLSTVSALGAQNIGAEKPERARQTLKYALIITITFGLIVAIVTQFCAENLVSLFTDSEKENGEVVIKLGGQYLRGYIWDVIFAGIHFSFSGYFCAIGKSIISFIHNIFSIGLARIPLVYLASTKFSETLFPMGLATVTGSVLSSIICIIVYIMISHNSIKLKNEE